MVKKIFVLIVLAATCAYGQSLGGSLMLGFPQSEFKDNVNRAGYGIQFQGQLWETTREMPYTFGLSFSYMVYGEVSETRPFPGFPEVYLDVNRMNNMANAHFLFYLSPFEGAFRPYLEGLFGGSYLFTTSEVKSRHSDEPFAEDTNYDDFNWSYGGGFGTQFLLTENLPGINSLFLDVKFRYLYGTEAEYLTEEDIEIVSMTQVRYNVRRSRTDVLTFGIGVVVNF
ncbi:hypothetical protein MROS_0676 [Melioribacter roseus P3M-2]|uniref:Outer membrane protein beta-barrel domain-containing protein n=1 Tax=Melioribacter roseus (strain DSM 23840 / JCM 17771 / VKM B-2668 / P3M-2) TaxID=1191523 RepID=I6ZPH4_MELRP|nr:hypothetical protein [Melioribacter roseus]AFN73919.1 hypothetical protein MROS_0676 [Melioribacter roseus P3M-2]